MDYVQVIFLYLLKKMNGNRSVFGIYHILTGKKTAQTLQDCRLFQVSKFFGVFKQFERSTVVKLVNSLLEKNLIKECGENRYDLTPSGEAFLSEQLTVQPLPIHLNGFIYKDVTDVFWRRCALLTQCVSFLKAQNREFIPVIKDGRTQLWVKRKLASNGNQTRDLANKLYSELEVMLKQFSTLEASIFVLRLSGAHRVGLTINQVARELQIELSYAKLLFINVIHGVITKATENKELFGTIYSILEKIETTNLLTETARKTYSLLNRGLSPEEISRTRHLKKNTVEDHIVEIALNCEDFSIEPFVAKETERAIIAVVTELNTRRLKEIKDNLSKKISYFEIRLTLAKKGF